MNHRRKQTQQRRRTTVFGALAAEVHKCCAVQLAWQNSISARMKPLVHRFVTLASQETSVYDSSQPSSLRRGTRCCEKQMRRTLAKRRWVMQSLCRAHCFMFSCSSWNDRMTKRRSGPCLRLLDRSSCTLTWVDSLDCNISDGSRTEVFHQLTEETLLLLGDP